MKKLFVYVVKTIIRNKLVRSTIALLILSQVAVAQTRLVAVREPVVSTASVKHIGNPEGSVVFQVQYDNQAGEKFFLIIRDNDGNVIYQDTYSDKKFDKKFQLPQGETDKLQFIIKGPRNNTIQTFEVKTHSRMIEEVVVRKVN
ncbi:hypothetical protein D3H65_24225 [Paraflavitalea soli]|uniref:DUF4384 domain-containing protein n=1 Tax=Paraflavitalea soli TaxID=2315862 RepID=A0A3B7MQY2_9BACT|nr:hypothetical protein [Paraflavitalea soli]AXY76902.1 hypothetical protein D3H65_24225 [Paraflavitalea soli]